MVIQLELHNHERKKKTVVKRFESRLYEDAGSWKTQRFLSNVLSENVNTILELLMCVQKFYSTKDHYGTYHWCENV